MPIKITQTNNGVLILASFILPHISHPGISRVKADRLRLTKEPIRIYGKPHLE